MRRLPTLDVPIKSGRGTRTEDTAATGRQARCVSRERWRLIVPELFPGSTPQSAYRESLIASILEKPFGIYGAEVCQSCGKAKTFHGWAGAMATHRGGGAFVCLDCSRVPGAMAGGRGNFCEICQGPAWETDGPGGRKYLCRPCRAALGRARPGQRAEQALAHLSPRRNLELRATEALETLDFNTEVMHLRKSRRTRKRFSADESSSARRRLAWGPGTGRRSAPTRAGAGLRIPRAGGADSMSATVTSCISSRCDSPTRSPTA